jgi:putative Ca2+/H+ antiporter (TMEM165/GDT1 family)
MANSVGESSSTVYFAGGFEVGEGQMDWQLFLSTFALIFVAELPDKTAFASLLLATRNNPFAVFLGAAAAFVIQSLVAVTFGSVFALLPERMVHVGAGILFLVFAIMMLRKKSEDEASAASSGTEAKSFWKTVTASFIVIFIAEWGDLTQLATATLQARYQAPVTLFIASTLALWAVTALGVTVGHYAKHAVNPATLQKVAAFALLGMGVYFLIA